MSMRRTIIIAGGLFLAGIASAQDQQTTQTTQQTSQNSDSVAAAARKARDQKKPQTAPAKTYTNDDVSAMTGGISTVGADTDEKKSDEKASPAGGETKPAADKKDEKYWRKRFTDLRQKIASTQSELDVLQRELNVAQKQYYPDPNAALQQQYSRDEINKKTDQIEAKKKELEDLNQQMTALEDELRRAGGDPGWAR
ncbi:MAG TPA: hypothetical protein VFO34_09795 [Candidatus Acidoferrales bacterium]|nr:hypothetical protein [Candidatus Acidoferrales bacterium]